MSSIDEEFYDRQLRAVGHDGMQKIIQNNVLIIGLSGLGVEIAKNTILSGVKSVVLYDNTPTSYIHLSSQFCLTKNDIGKPIAEASLEKLRMLNQRDNVSVFNGELNSEFISNFQVIVLVNQRLELQLKLNDMARLQKIKFILAESRGVFGRVFSDFGENYVVSDPNDNFPGAHKITGISDKGEITVADPILRTELEKGDTVIFRGVKGLPINENEKPEGFKIIQILGSSSIKVENLPSGNYISGGFITSVKKVQVLNFKSLRESLEEPEYVISDYSKKENSTNLHIGFQAIESFQSIHNSLPSPMNTQHADQVLSIAKELASKKNIVINEELIKQLSFGAQGDISPMASIIGSIASQEVLKATTGKFHPILQHFYFDAVEILPENVDNEEYTPQESRYDGNTITFGRSLSDKLQKLNLFLVGAGSIGCEMLKSWAMMGVACGGGKIHLTDMDSICISNLSNQFLYRPTDIGSLKSNTAATAISQLNSDLDLVAYSLCMNKKSEDVFNGTFYGDLFGICSAVDNLAARYYIDNQCVEHRKIFLDSGISGAKGHVQVIIPFKTESYNASKDVPTQEAPHSTTHSFPYKITHTLEWARDTFNQLFTIIPTNINSFSDSTLVETIKYHYVASKVETLEQIAENIKNRPLEFAQCLSWARLKFEELFCNKVKNLLINFPSDYVTSDGRRFWTEHKTAPTPLSFDINDPLHFAFVISAANLRAFSYGISVSKHDNDIKFVKEVLSTVTVPNFTPAIFKAPASDEKQYNEQMEEKANEILSELTEYVSSNSINTLSVSELNLANKVQMDFINSTSNLRARNYEIPQSDNFQTMGLLGNIVPIMVSSASLVAGLACLELLKLVQGKKLEIYKNSFFNLSVPMFTHSEPVPPQRKIITPEWSFTQWDVIEINGDLTLQEFMEYFKQKYQLKILMMAYEVSMLYSFFMKNEKLQKILPLKMSKLANAPAYKKHIILDLCCSDDADNDIDDVPQVKVILS